MYQPLCATHAAAPSRCSKPVICEHAFKAAGAFVELNLRIAPSLPDDYRYCFGGQPHVQFPTATAQSKHVLLMSTTRRKQGEQTQSIDGPGILVSSFSLARIMAGWNSATWMASRGHHATAGQSTSRPQVLFAFRLYCASALRCRLRSCQFDLLLIRPEPADALQMRDSCLTPTHGLERFAKHTTFTLTSASSPESCHADTQSI